jgi:hypothetical protein
VITSVVMMSIARMAHPSCSDRSPRISPGCHAILNLWAGMASLNRDVAEPRCLCLSECGRRSCRVGKRLIARPPLQSPVGADHAEHPAAQSVGRTDRGPQRHRPHRGPDPRSNEAGKMG